MIDILSICQEAADITAAARPDNLFDQGVQHNAIFLSVIKSELDSLVRYGDWQALVKEGTLCCFSDKTFYGFDEVASDFYALIHNTIYVKDSAEKVIGAIEPAEWMKRKYQTFDDGKVCFKIDNNGFRFLKTPPENLKIVFMYRSNAVCFDGKTLEVKSAVSKNTDVPVFDAYLVKLGVIWRFLKRSGMDYEEEYNEYQRELKKRFGVEMNVKDIKLANGFDERDGNEAVQIVLKGC